MPPIRDAMPAFELFQPASVTDALGILDRHGADAWVMAGGMDTFDWLKDRIKKPRVVVDLGMVNELRGITDAGGGVEIGAMTTLTTIANNPLIKERFPMLSAAALIVASPQIRNQGTLGGNVSQDARCWRRWLTRWATTSFAARRCSPKSSWRRWRTTARLPTNR